MVIKVTDWWREGLGWVFEADQQAIKDAQEALDEFNREEEINELEKQKEEALEAIDEQINAWEEYKKAWEDVADDYETQQARLILAQMLGAEAEEKILQQKLDVLEEYKKKYLETMKELEEINKTPSTDASINGDGTYNPSAGGSGGGSSSAPSLQKGSYVSVKPGTKWYANSYGGGSSGNAQSGTIRYVNPSGTHPYNIDGLGWVRKSDIVGYRDGGIVDYTGLAMLHGTPNNPEFVLNNSQMKKIFSYLKSPVSNNMLGNQSNTVNYNFGNISLPNVNNARQFITELKSLVNTTRNN